MQVQITKYNVHAFLVKSEEYLYVKFGMRFHVLIGHGTVARRGNFPTSSPLSGEQSPVCYRNACQLIRTVITMPLEPTFLWFNVY